ncbi:MAG: UDP-N-acetyl-D-mannosamine dehydrogenase [Anaerolineaceae bacterium]|nr:UDP-N-acetyl-D-mannosamine dehydrogenase [Anaerolineaceae bacterium]
MNFEKISILGLGYIGLPTASMFAYHGVQVYGMDVNPKVLEALNQGRLHIHEPGLLEFVHNVINNGKLVVNDFVCPSDAFIIAVPTPFYGEKLADLSYVKNAAEAIVPHLKKGNLVVLESTSPPLTTQNILVPILEKSGLKAGEDFLLAYSPERVLPGQILRELVENARVIGGINSESAQAGKDLYKIFVKGEIITTTAATAEMVKIMENTYRDVNIAIANEFSRLSERFGVDVWEAIKIANLHPRVNILNPGPGVGGHCISVDPWFFVESAPDLTKLILAARQVNDSQPDFVVNQVEKILGNLQNKKIAVLGLAYKPDVDDLRESPAIDIVTKLSKLGAFVTAFEPFKLDFDLKYGQMAQNLGDAIKETDLILVLVAHSEFKNIDLVKLKNLSNTNVIYDAVNIWDKPKLEDLGFQIFKLGVSEL